MTDKSAVDALLRDALADAIDRVPGRGSFHYTTGYADAILAAIPDEVRDGIADAIIFALAALAAEEPAGAEATPPGPPDPPSREHPEPMG